MANTKNLWNNLCKVVEEGKNVKQKEYAFEGSIKNFLARLGWSTFDENLKEQYQVPVGHQKIIPDFVLLEPASKRPEIVIELKRPGHYQKDEDITQLRSYMKQIYCLFGLYIGEKLEIYYNELETREEPVLINSIEFSKDNEEGQYLLNNLFADDFEESKWTVYCNDFIKLKASIKYWTSDQGKTELFNFIIDRAGLSPNNTSRLKSLLNLEVSKISESQEEAPQPEEEEPTEEVIDEGVSEPATPSPQPVAFKKYGLNDETPINKRKFAYEVIKRFVETHPEMKYKDITKLFDKTNGFNAIFVSEKEWKQKSLDGQGRYFRGDMILTDTDGKRFLVSNQWTQSGIEKIIVPLAEKMGYSIKRL